MANKEYTNRDKKKRSARDFRELEELKDTERKPYTNKEISVIKPVEIIEVKNDEESNL